jgi:hypothetical protein
LVNSAFKNTPATVLSDFRKHWMSEQFKLLLNKSQKIIFPLTLLHGIYFAYKKALFLKSPKSKEIILVRRLIIYYCSQRDFFNSKR